MKNFPQAFEKALVHTLEFEGGYANVRDDSGGETFRGVSRTNWPAWAGWDLIDRAKSGGLIRAKDIDARFSNDAEMKALVAELYHDNFWITFERLGIPPLATAKLFDTAVNVGVGRAVKLLQETLNDMGALLKVDGAAGLQTVSAAKNVFARPGSESDFMNRFAGRQAAFYRGLPARKPSQEKFLKGWLRRAEWLPR